MTLLRDTKRQLAEGIVRQRDELLLSKIHERIGEFQLESLRGRLACITYANDPVRLEEWTLDGLLLAIFYPVDFDMVGMTIKVTQRYRVAPTP